MLSTSTRPSPVLIIPDHGEKHCEVGQAHHNRTLLRKPLLRKPLVRSFSFPASGSSSRAGCHFQYAASQSPPPSIVSWVSPFAPKMKSPNTSVSRSSISNPPSPGFGLGLVSRMRSKRREKAEKENFEYKARVKSLPAMRPAPSEPPPSTQNCPASPGEVSLDNYPIFFRTYPSSDIGPDSVRKEDRFLGRVLSYEESPSWEYHAYDEDNKRTSIEYSPTVDGYASLYPSDTFCDGGALVPMKAAMLLGLQDKPAKSCSGSLYLVLHRDPTDIPKQDTPRDEQPMFFVLGDEVDEDGGCALLPLHVRY